MAKSVAEQTDQELFAYITTNKGKAEELRNQAQEIETGLEEAKQELGKRLGLTAAPAPAGKAKAPKGEKQTRRRISAERKAEVPKLILSAIGDGLNKFADICERMDDIPESIVRKELTALIPSKVTKVGDKKDTTYILKGKK